MNDYEETFDERVVEQLMRDDMSDNFEALMPAHAAYQRKMAKKYFTDDHKFLNIGCKEDPAKLGDWKQCLNLDILEYDHGEGVDLKANVPNFINANYLEWQCDDHTWDGIVLGEVLEHCTMEVGARFACKMATELKDDGILIITVPQDHRSKEDQIYEQSNRIEQFFEVAPGITSWHQTCWTKQLLEELFSDVGMEIIEEDYDTAWWFKDRGIFWHLFTARKTNA